MSFLDSPVLALNRGWQAVSFLPCRTVICTVMRDMGSILDPETYELLTLEAWSERSYEGMRTITTTAGALMVPDVVVFKKYGERPPRRITFGRVNLARRDEYRCQYCGDTIGVKGTTVDHVMPRSRGGPLTWENTVAACRRCNGRKADRTPEEAGMPLRKRPAKPTWKPRLPVPQGSFRKAWEPFLKTA